MKFFKPYNFWKRPVALLLAIVFLFSSLGFTFFAHHCPYKGSSISLSAEKGCCCSEDERTEDNCCKNKSFQIKIKGKYEAPKSLDFDIAKADIPPSRNMCIEVYWPVVKVKRKQFHYSNSSPPGTTPPIFIFNRSILI